MVSKNLKKTGIIGENILVIEKNIYALYIIDSINYSTLNETGINNHIARLETLVTALANSRAGFSFSLVQIKKTLTSKDICSNIIGTVKLWDPNYKDIPEIFKAHIEDSEQTITILVCNIDIIDIGEIEGQSLYQIGKTYLQNLTNILLSMKEIVIDSDRIIGIEKQLHDIISRYGTRTSRELTFYMFVSSLFPSYSISYDNNSYISNRASEILGVIDQEIIGSFGYFTMSNIGIDMFGLEQNITYGCLLEIVKFPKIINSDNFNLNIPGLRINVKTIPKDKSKLMIKRNRAALEFENETAAPTGARRDNELEENLDLVEIALENLAKGSLMCEMNATILLLSSDLKELRTNRSKLITTLADIGVFATISSNQAQDFIDNYVKLRPKSYRHLTELRFPVSLQIDNGTYLGCYDSNFANPPIGLGL